MQVEVKQNREVEVRKFGIYRCYIKRILDFIISLIALLFILPLMIIVAIVIKLESKGPVFFIQNRLGQNMKVFKIYKFRTMTQDAVKYQKVGIEVTGNDPRITSFGKFLRRFKIDELPQLFNILKGDMSIIGPRPTLPDYIDQYEKWELKRFYVRPGLTGMAQINGNIYLQRQEKSLYDVKYVENINFLMDMKIILKTVAIVIFGEDKYINKTEIKM